MTSRLVVNSVRHTSASSDAITMDASGNVTFPGNATCSGTPSGFGGGKVGQVIQTVKKDRFSTTSSTFVDITGMTVTITPSATSSKILVSFTGVGGNSGNQAYNHCRLNRSIGGGSYNGTFIVGDLANNETQSSIDMSVGSLGSAHPAACTQTYSFEYLDSPNTTSAIIYKLQVCTTNSGTSGTFVFGGSSGIGDYNGRSAPCFLTVKEILA